MVGYVLLIAIAVALSTAVFFYLKLYLPDERPECDVDIKLSIDYASCTLNRPTNPLFSTINLNITNRGLFKVEGAYVKIGDYNRAFRENLNLDLNLNSICNGNTSVLNPGEKFCKTYTYNLVPTQVQEISVQPVIWIENEPVLCPEAVVTKIVPCVAP
ncbi:MAG: hypothetical protein AABX23_03845 [Nanoarchaeota archaeon]